MISLPWANLHIIYFFYVWTFIPPSKNAHQPSGSHLVFITLPCETTTKHSRTFYSVNSLCPMFIFPYTPPLYGFRTNTNSQTTVVETSEARKVEGETINDKSIYDDPPETNASQTLSKSLFWMGSPWSILISCNILKIERPWWDRFRSHINSSNESTGWWLIPTFLVGHLIISASPMISLIHLSTRHEPQITRDSPQIHTGRWIGLEHKSHIPPWYCKTIPLCFAKCCLCPFWKHNFRVSQHKSQIRQQSKMCTG